MLNMLGAVQGGSSVLGGVTDFFESRRQSDIVKTQAQIAKRRLAREGRRAVSNKVTSVAGKGVKLDDSSLMSINRIQAAYEMDRLIVGEGARLERNAIERKGKAQLVKGIMGGVAAFKPSPDIGLSGAPDVEKMQFGADNEYGATITGRPLPVDWKDTVRLDKNRPLKPMTWDVGFADNEMANLIKGL